MNIRFVLIVSFVVACFSLPAMAADKPPIEMDVADRHANYGREARLRLCRV